MNEALNYLSPYDFTQWACEQVRDGYGLVPFVGSGISARSGILMGVEFMNFLTWTVYRCVANQEDQKTKRYNLHKEGWPRQPQPSEVKEVKEWVWKIFKRACGDCGLEPLRVDAAGEACVRRIAPLEGNEMPLESALRRPLVPHLLKSSETNVDDTAIRAILRALCHDDSPNSFRGDPWTSPTSARYIEEFAVRSLHDWRSTLDFLSRLRLCGDDRMWLDATADPAVVDSFNLYITRGRRPNLAHGMLCHLAHRTRSRTILTTNFDTLIEDAFTDLGESYAVFPVSLNGSLPPPDSVHAQNCIIKMHGGLADTRASHSLDDPPSQEDKGRFFHYVRGRYPNEPANGGGFLPSHLLVCGYSGTDMRCVQMIKYLLDSDPEAQVFWICYSEGDMRKLQQLFAKEGYAIAESLGLLHEQMSNNDGRIRSRLIATVSTRPDLLLYELYQRLTLALPRGGFNFPLSHNVPPEESFRPEAGEEKRGEVAERIINAVLDRRHSEKIVVADGGSGLTAPLRQAFNELVRRGLRGVWLELDYYADEWALGHAIFEQIGLQLGRFQLDHARFTPPVKGEDPDWSEHIRLLSEYWNIEPSNWLIVLNGRNGPGGCAGWEQNYWCDEVYPKVQKLLEALIRAKKPASQADHLERNSSAADREGSTAGPGGFKILYAPYSRDRGHRDCQKQAWLESRAGELLKIAGKGSSYNKLPSFELENEEWKDLSQRHCVCKQSKRDSAEGGIALDSIVASLDGKNIHIERLAEEPRRSFEQTIKDAITLWFEPESKSHGARTSLRRHFLYSTTLFRHARHLASFSSKGVYPPQYEFNFGETLNVGLDNDWIRSLDLGEWLEKLNVQHRLILCTPGGHAWMHRDARLGIQHIAEFIRPWALEPKTRLDGPPHYNRAINIRARTHFWIANWYRRAFCTTGHALPLLEALYHFAECITYAPFAEPEETELPRMLHEEPENTGQPGDSSARLEQHRRYLAKHAAFEMIKSLRLGSSAIGFWAQPSAGDAWFGYEAVEGSEGKKGLKALLERSFKQIYQGEKDPDWSRWLALLLGELRHHPNLDDVRPSVAERAPSENGLNPIDTANSSCAETTAFPPLPLEVIENCDGVEWLLEFINRAIEGDAKRRSTEGGNQHTEDFRQRAANLRNTIKELDEHICADKGDRSAIRKCVQQLRNELITQRPFSEKPLWLARAVCEAAYLHVHSARLIEHVTTFESIGDKPALDSVFPNSAFALWIRMCALCKLSLGLCFEVHPQLFKADFRLRVQALTLCGLALGHLGRFFEAQNCIDSAHALLTRAEGAVKLPDVSKIHLRAAEVHLVEAHLLRRLLALLPSKLPDGKCGAYDDNAQCNPVPEALRGNIRNAITEIVKDLASRQNGDNRPHHIQWLCGTQWFPHTIEYWTYEPEDSDKDVRMEFFMRLTAALLGRSAAEEKAEREESRIKAAVIVAAQYCKMYSAHLRLENEQQESNESGGSNKKRRIDWSMLRKSLERQHYAKLDDAWMSLESAEHALSGRSHSSRWWGRLNSLRLVVYAEHAEPYRSRDSHGPAVQIPRTLAFRARQNALERIETTYRATRSASPATFHWTIRAIHNAARATHSVRKLGRCELKAAQRFFETLKEDLCKALREEFRKVPKKVFCASGEERMFEDIISAENELCNALDELSTVMREEKPFHNMPVNTRFLEAVNNLAKRLPNPVDGNQCTTPSPSNSLSKKYAMQIAEYIEDAINWNGENIMQQARA